MSETTVDDRAALKARFSGFTNARTLQAPSGNEDQPRTILTETLTANEPVMRAGFDQIKLKVRRDQKKSAFGKVGFSVHFIVEMSPDAHDAIKHYQFGKIILYQKPLELKFSLNMFVVMWRGLWLWLTRSRWQVTVNDLVRGRTVHCRHILDVLQTEDDVREAAALFGKILRAASWFGGEEVVEL
jgi:hypothetical protein